MTNPPTPLETAISTVEISLDHETEPDEPVEMDGHAIGIILSAAKQLSILRQNSVSKSVWDETHAKYLEECEKNLPVEKRCADREAMWHKAEREIDSLRLQLETLQTANEGLKIRLRALGDII